MTFHQSLYEKYVAEIGEAVRREVASPVSLRRNIYRESEFLQRLAGELHYTPPSPRSLRGHLQHIRERRRAEEAEQRQWGKRTASRVAELVAEQGKLRAVIEGANFYVESIDVLDAAISRLAAVNHLLSLAPELPAHGLDETLEANAASDAHIRAEVDALRAWLARLEVEHQRIKADIEAAEQSGAQSEGGQRYPPRPLYTQLEAVIRATRDAEENLREAAQEFPETRKKGIDLHAQLYTEATPGLQVDSHGGA